jgi:predicted small lipoprotein YifL
VIAAVHALLALHCVTTLAACGKKGPPLAPLRPVPAPPTDPSIRRVGPEVQIRFKLPATNLNAPGTVDLDRVEIYAVTVAPGAAVPANQNLLTSARVVGTIAVKPPPVEGEPPAPSEADKRPAPGDVVTFVEELTPEKLAPEIKAAVPATPAEGGAATRPTDLPSKPEEPAEAAPAKAGEPGVKPAPAPAQAGAAAKPPLPTYASRVYVVRGLSRAGRAGQPSSRMTLPLAGPPPPPGGVAAKFTEKSVLLDWTPPVAEVGGDTVGFRVYRSAAPGAPLNEAPVTTAAYEHPELEFGVEQCFVVRTLVTIAGAPIESEPSAPACVMPRDVFPPSAPKGLQVVADEGGISLTWDANTEPDVAGYVILRGEAPGDTLQPITPAPIRETTYRDTGVQSGVRYVYVVAAVDSMTPPNTSQHSERQEVTAR